MSYFTSFDGTKLYYEHVINRPKHSRTIVFLHGMAENSLCFQQLTQELGMLIRINYNFVVVDYRGHGRSSAKHASTIRFSDVVTDIILLCKYLHLDQIVLITSSIGFQIACAMLLSERLNIKKVIAISPFFCLSEKQVALYRIVRGLGRKVYESTHDNGKKTTITSNVHCAADRNIWHAIKTMSFISTVTGDDDGDNIRNWEQVKKYAPIMTFVHGNTDEIALLSVCKEYAKYLGVSVNVVNGTHNLITGYFTGVLPHINRVLIRLISQP